MKVTTGEEAGQVTEEPLIPVRMLNEFTYCPRLAYLEWVQGNSPIMRRRWTGGFTIAGWIWCPSGHGRRRRKSLRRTNPFMNGRCGSLLSNWD